MDLIVPILLLAIVGVVAAIVHEQPEGAEVRKPRPKVLDWNWPPKENRRAETRFRR